MNEANANSCFLTAEYSVKIQSLSCLVVLGDPQTKLNICKQGVGEKKLASAFLVAWNSKHMSGPSVPNGLLDITVG